MVIELIAAGVFAVVALGEALHARRCRRVAHLAFGPGGRPAPWVRSVPTLRSLSAAALAWGLLTLLSIEPKIHMANGIADDEDPKHLVLVLDVSPSMTLADAGPTGQQSRRARARDLIESMFSRVSLGRFEISVIAVYNGAKPVVVDTDDRAVVNNILDDLPMHFAFRPGQTQLFDGISEAARVAKTWQAKSTIVVLVSDGDTVPATGTPELPPSVSDVVVVGVGDPIAGTFIDGHQSRQDVSALRQIANRLGGTYHDGNQRHVPTAILDRISRGTRRTKTEHLTRREYALICIGVGAGLLALLPFLLHLFGTQWRPGTPVSSRLADNTGNSAPNGTERLSRKAAAAR